jgi:hypothetical protein
MIFVLLAHLLFHTSIRLECPFCRLLDARCQKARQRALIPPHGGGAPP